MLLECTECGVEFTYKHGKAGLKHHCPDCSQDSVVKYTGVMVYDHKTSAQIQINANPLLTKYIIASTKLRNKGSNLGNNLKVSGDLSHTTGGVVVAPDKINYKQR